MNLSIGSCLYFMDRLDKFIIKNDNLLEEGMIMTTTIITKFTSYINETDSTIVIETPKFKYTFFHVNNNVGLVCKKLYEDGPNCHGLIWVKLKTIEFGREDFETGEKKIVTEILKEGDLKPQKIETVIDNPTTSIEKSRNKIIDDKNSFEKGWKKI